MTARSPMPERVAFTVREAGELIGCGHTAVYKLIKARQLRFVNIGRRVFIRREEIDRFLAEAEAEKGSGLIREVAS